MGVDEEFERVRTALRVEEQALAREFEQIDAEARAAVDASVEHVREQLATQADRIREAIAQQREEVEAHSQELREDVEHHDEHLTGPSADATYATDGSDTTGEQTVDGHEVDEPTVDDAAVEPHAVEQPDGTTVDQVTPGADETDELIGDVERGD